MLWYSCAVCWHLLQQAVLSSCTYFFWQTFFELHKYPTLPQDDDLRFPKKTRVVVESYIGSPRLMLQKKIHHGRSSTSKLISTEFRAFKEQSKVLDCSKELQQEEFQWISMCTQPISYMYVCYIAASVYFTQSSLFPCVKKLLSR